MELIACGTKYCKQLNKDVGQPGFTEAAMRRSSGRKMLRAKGWIEYSSKGRKLGCDTDLIPLSHVIALPSSKLPCGQEHESGINNTSNHSRYK
jgi:hypothetical protein